MTAAVATAALVWQLWWVSLAVLVLVTVMVLVTVVVALAEYRQQSTNWGMKQCNLF
jgi:hypothetical protein